MKTPFPLPAPRTAVPFLVIATLALGFVGACSGNDPDPGETPADAGDDGADAGTMDAGGDTGTGDGGGGGGGVCSPTAQTGCAEPTTKCGIVGNKFGCQTAGTVQQGEACAATGSGDNCAAGLFCMNGSCHRFCDPSAGMTACPTGQACSLEVVWNGGGANGEQFNACVVQGSECDPLLQDCADPAHGCFATSAGNKCYVPGTLEDGAACTSANACKKGSTCISTGGSLACRAFCTPPGAADGGNNDADAGEADAGMEPAPITCATGMCMDTGDGYGICN